MTVLGAIAGRESRAISSLPWGPWQGEQYGPAWSGANVTTETSLQLLAVYGCVRLISDQISTLPLDVFRKGPDGSPEEMAMPAWLDEPVIGLHRVAWLTQIISSLLLAGNAYLAVMRFDGRIVELVPLDPEQVKVTRENGRRVVTVAGSTPGYDVVHIPGLMLPGTDVGLSPVEYARQAIGLGLTAQEFGARYFTEDGTMPGVIETAGELTPDQAKEMAQSWARSRRKAGETKTKLPGVLVGGAAWKPTTVSNEQAQFLETRGYTDAQIAGQMFLVDPSELGIPVPGTSLTYSNRVDRDTRRMQVSCLPWIVRIETALSKLLAQPRYVKFNQSAPMRADQKGRFDAYAVGITTGFLTPNEARSFEDWPDLPGGDTPPAPPEGDPNGDQGL